MQCQCNTHAPSAPLKDMPMSGKEHTVLAGKMRESSIFVFSLKHVYFIRTRNQQTGEPSVTLPCGPIGKDSSVHPDKEIVIMYFLMKCVGI
jgi:hypothetical protein